MKEDGPAAWLMSYSGAENEGRYEVDEKTRKFEALTRPDLPTPLHVSDATALATTHNILHVY